MSSICLLKETHELWIRQILKSILQGEAISNLRQYKHVVGGVRHKQYDQESKLTVINRHRKLNLTVTTPILYELTVTTVTKFKLKMQIDSPQPSSKIELDRHNPKNLVIDRHHRHEIQTAI